MMKDKKKVERKANKPQTFFRLFISAWMPIGIVTLLLLIVGNGLFYNYVSAERIEDYTNSVEEEVTTGFMELMQRLEEDRETQFPFLTDAEAQYMARLHFRLCSEGSIGYPMALFTKEDGQYTKWMDSSETMFIIIRENNADKTLMFECSPEHFSEEALQYLEMDVDSEELLDVAHRIQLKECYIKGNSFLPGAYDVVLEDYSAGGEKIQVLDSYPGVSDVPTGYEHLDFDEGDWTIVFSPILIGYQAEDEIQQKIFDLETEMDQINTNFVSSQEFCPHGFAQADVITMWPVFLYDKQEDSEILAVSGYHYNLWKEYGVWTIFTAVFALLFSVGIGAGIAGKYYRSYQLRLKMDAYRKETTNSLAHDLKSPLMVISGYAENLKESIHEEKREYYADSIIETVSYMNEIIENLFVLAKVEDNTYVLQKEKIDLHQMTLQQFEQFEDLIQKKQLTCRIVGAGEGNFDAFLMKRVLSNLIGNAVKFSPKQGSITVEIENETYRITNSGSIEQEKLEHAFEPLIKGNKERSGENGSGLGLAIVKNILDLHECTYTLKNSEQGVCFTVIFPKSEE